jgi:adenosylhomocysteine nucleosidase
MHRIFSFPTHLLFLIIFVSGLSACSRRENPRYAVIISANAEWRSLNKVWPGQQHQDSPWGNFFFRDINGNPVLFFHEGWGKVDAAGATQYVIDRFNPEVLINLGTCGGIEGRSKRHEIILVNQTYIYDIYEAMGDSKEALDYYATSLDLSWLGKNYPFPVTESPMISADRDLKPAELESLKIRYSAVAGDWETGAIAHVAKKNEKNLIILRGVTDVVTPIRGEAYNNLEHFAVHTDTVMQTLTTQLPEWINHIEKSLENIR